MAGREDQLSKELTRIICCPYAASLTTLANILVRAHDRTVRAAICDRPPCAISRLAKIISDSLQHWPYVIQILQALCQSTEFQDAILVQNPAILDTLLNKANSTQCEFDEYAKLCLLLLSRRLPEALSLPASAHSFFLRVFERAIKAPDVHTFKPVYLMLNGACRELISLLPPDARDSFDEQLCHTLKSHSTGQNPMFLLWCFGITILAERPHEVGRTESPFSTPSIRTSVTNSFLWQTESGRKLYGSEVELKKLIYLTCLSVIWACKGDVGVSDSEAVEGIRIAIRTIHFINQETRQAWPKSNDRAKNTFLKLPEKVLRNGIDPTVQLEALCFYAMIAGQNNIPKEIVAQYEISLLNISTIQTDADTFRETISESLPLFAPQLHKSTIRQLLSGILTANSTSECPHELHNISALVEVLAAAATHCESLRSQILFAMSSNELQKNVQDFLSAPVERHSKDTACDTFTNHLRRTLLSSTISMLLTSALTTQSNECGLPPTIAIDLISKQQKLAISPTQCRHQLHIAQPKISLFEQECTPATLLHRQDWRDRLKTELNLQSSHQHDTLIRSMTLIIQDLEERCNNVEGPLRREQDKVKDLLVEISQLRKEMELMEINASDRRDYIDGLEAERENVEVERDNLSSKLSDLQAELANANRQAGKTLFSAQENFNTKEAELRSMVLMHEDDLRMRQEQIENLKEEMEQLSEKIRQEEHKRASLDELHENLKTEFANLETNLHTERQTVSEQTRELAQLGDEKDGFENQLGHTREELATTRDQWNDIHAKYQELVQMSETTLEDLKAKHEDEVKRTARRASEEYNNLDAKLQDALEIGEQAKNAFERIQRDLQHAQATISMLEDKVEQLTDDVSCKDDELHELRSLQNGMLALMNTALPKHRGDYSNHPGPSPKTPRQHRRRKSAIQRPLQDAAPLDSIETQGFTDTAMENIANASFTSSDSSTRKPTPKRLKPRPSFKIPATRDPYGHKTLNTSRSSSKRQALKSISPNRRHTTAGFATTENENFDEKRSLGEKKGSLHSIDQESFSIDDFHTSTPFTPGNFVCSTGREPPDCETG